MKMHKWSDVKARSKVSPERRLQIQKEVAAEVLEYDLRQLRDAAGMTQEEVAAKLDVAQPTVARTEAGVDSRISTIRKYVTALGGELKIQAVIKGKTVELVV